MILIKLLDKHIYSEKELIEEEIRNSKRNGSKEYGLPTHRCLISYKHNLNDDDSYITVCYGNNNWVRCIGCRYENS